MANEDKKDFNVMLMDSKDMPKIQIITDEKSIEKYGGDKLYFAPPIAYSCAMKSHFRKSGNQMSGKWKSSYASLLA